MARIRSVHPSLFTDEAWVSCSPMARVLYIGLWTDADDQGLFEWKPLQIRMRLLPGDNADVPGLLAELVSVNLIAQFDSAGKRLGAIRKFRRFQRPKKPNALFVLPPEWRTYVGLSDDGSELDEAEDDAVPPKGEIPEQMEDGGGRREEVSEAIASSVAAGDCEDGFEALWMAYPHVKGRSSKPKSRLAWGRIAEATRRDLPAAAARFAADGVMPQNGPCALQRWLDDALWLDWLVGPDGPRPERRWSGPADVRAAFLAQLGEEWVGSYLDHCTWQDVPERALIPATRYAGSKLVREGRSVLAALGLSVLERAA